MNLKWLEYLNPFVLDANHPLIIRVLHLPFALAAAVAFGLAIFIGDAFVALGTGLLYWLTLSGTALSIVFTIKE